MAGVGVAGIKTSTTGATVTSGFRATAYPIVMVFVRVEQLVPCIVGPETPPEAALSKAIDLILRVFGGICG